MEEQAERRQAIDERVNKLARKWKWQEKGKQPLLGSSTKQSSRNKGYKALALEMGMTPSKTHQSLYRSEKLEDVLFNAQGVMTVRPACGVCNDVGFFSMKPRSRPSRGAWDSELVVCQLSRRYRLRNPCPISRYKRMLDSSVE